MVVAEVAATEVPRWPNTPRAAFADLKLQLVSRIPKNHGNVGRWVLISVVHRPEEEIVCISIIVTASSSPP
jgi:hypothetical protein